jgi:hypothetical protein
MLPRRLSLGVGKPGPVLQKRPPIMSPQFLTTLRNVTSLYSTPGELRNNCNKIFAEFFCLWPAHHTAREDSLRVL